MHSTYTGPVTADPCSSDINGGIEVWTAFLNRSAVQSINDSSMVCFYLYAGWLFVCPGDICPTGWRHFRSLFAAEIRNFVNRSSMCALVAPHHGRTSGYSAEMVSDLHVDLVLISDKWGKEPTDQRFRTPPGHVVVNNEQVRFVSTKSSGRVQMGVHADGNWWIDYGEFN